MTVGARGFIRHLVTVARFGLGAVLLFYIARRLDVRELGHILSGSPEHWTWWMVGVLFMFLGLLAGAARWRGILAAQGTRMPTSEVVWVFFIGQFFNAFMLGACGGDVVRAYYASRRSPGKRAEAVSTVFADRAIGLFVMIVFCCALIAIRLPLFLDHKGTRMPGFLMFLFLVASVLAMVALFRRNLFEHWALFRRLEQGTRVGPLIRRAYEALYLYRLRPKVMAMALVYSLLNLVLLTLACAAFGLGLDITIPLKDYFTLFPIISVIAAVPITPGSLGVRESLFVAMFSSVDVDAAHAVLLSLVGYAASLVWSLFGGVLFLGWSAGAGRSVSEEIRQIQSSAETTSDEDGQ